MDYTQKLKKAILQANSSLCVGLDPNLDRIPDSVKKTHPEPERRVVEFLKKVIDVTSDSCAAYKPNLAFFEALGSKGLSVFQEIIQYIPDDKIIIADAKRGDISSTAEHYAKAYFESFDVDAVTLNPLMGFESLAPFLHYPEKGIYTLTLTSNPGAEDFLKQLFRGASSMAQFIAGELFQQQRKVSTHLGMVVGATQADEMEPIIQRHQHGALLIPGIGAQGGSIHELERCLKEHPGLALVSSSRSILYAGTDLNWPDAVRESSQLFKEKLQAITQIYVN